MRTKWSSTSLARRCQTVPNRKQLRHWLPKTSVQPEFRGDAAPGSINIKARCTALARVGAAAARQMAQHTQLHNAVGYSRLRRIVLGRVNRGLSHAPVHVANKAEVWSAHLAPASITVPISVQGAFGSVAV